MSIEKEFVPYQESLELKELGFDEPCFGFYQLEYGEIRPTMVDDNEQYRLTGFRTCKNSEIPKHYTSAPTFSQAFRWFREKYGYLSYIDMDNYSFYRYTIYKGKGISKAPFETYEETELACMRKLIEIVKQKS